MAVGADLSAFGGLQSTTHNLFKFMKAHKGVRPDRVTGHESAPLPILARRGIWVEPRKQSLFVPLEDGKAFLFVALL